MRVEPGLSVAPGPVARIRDAGGGIAGTGFLVGDRHVMTCAHVIDDAIAGRNRGDTERPETQIMIDLPFLDRAGFAGTVVVWCAMRPMGDLERDPVSDIAVLELAEPVMGGLATRAAVLSRPAVGTGFQTFGFPAGIDNGTEAGGELRMTDAGGWHQLRDTQDHGYFVEAGFSGAPVLALEPDREGRARLLGMVVAADVDPSRRLAFAVPTATLAQAWPCLARPYKELEAFGPEDADLFFGRDTFVEELVGKVATRPFLTVIGPSGSGKSSVVMAGLVPWLRAAGGWAVADCRPRRRPLYQLAHAIAMLGADPEETKGARHARTEELEEKLRADPGRIVDIVETTLGMLPQASRLLLVIDQFEELFTLDAKTAGKAGGEAETVSKTDPEAEAGTGASAISARIAEFVAVLEAIGRQPGKTPVIHAVATLRADFTGQALKIRALADLMRDADVKLGPMTPAELSQAIEAPAGRFGVAFAPGLVPEIVTEMARSPGGLPLMQFALDRLWQRQRDRELTREDYEAVGGVEGALAEHAEEFWAACSAADGERLRRILLRLVRLAPPGEQAEDTRAVALRSEIGEDNWPLVRDLVEARLVMTGRDPVSGQETVEVVHEALIRAWPRLKAWLDEDREFGLWRQRLQTYLADHATRSTVLTGDLLAEAEAWQATHGEALNSSETALIAASVEARKAEEERARMEQQERVDLLEERNAALAETTQRQRTWTNRLVTVLGLLLLALGTSAYFWWSSEQESDRAVTAEGIARVERTRAIASEAEAIEQREVAETQRDRAVAAAEAARVAEERAREAAREAKGRQVAADARLSQAEIRGNTAAERAAALAIEAWRLVPSSTAYQVAAKAFNDLPVAKFDHSGPATLVAFSPAGKRVVTASQDGTALIVDMESLSELTRVDHDGPVTLLAFSLDGRRLATASGDVAWIVDLENGAKLARVKHGDMINSIVFNPDGSRLATASRDGMARIFDGGDAEEIARAKHGDWVTAVAFSPDGTKLTTASADGTARIVDAESGTELSRVEHDGPVVSVAFSPDGARIATASRDGTARIVDTGSGAEIARVEHGDWVASVTFSADGRRLATVGRDRTVRIVDADSGAKIAGLEHEGTVWSVAFSPDGNQIATASGSLFSSNGTALIVDVDSGLEIARVLHDDAVVSVEFSPEGNRLATASFDETARIIENESGAELLRMQHGSRLNAVAFSPGGRWIATVTVDGAVRIVDAESGWELAKIRHGGEVRSVSFSPDGGRLATASGDGTVRIVDVSSGAERARVEQGNTLTSVAFSPDGKLLAIAGDDGTARILDARSGAELTRVEHGDWVMSVAFSPDGTRLATASLDGTARIVDTGSGAELTRVEHGDYVFSVAFSPDGTRLATASIDGGARISNAGDGSELERFVHDGLVVSVAFSPDGKRLATGERRAVRVIDFESGSEIVHSVQGAVITSVAFNADGTRLAMGSEDGTARIIDVESGAELARMDHSGSVSSVAFSLDGEWLATASWDGSARIVEGNLSMLIDRLCKTRSGRNLTRDEWRQYIGDPAEWRPTCPEWRTPEE